MEIINPIGTIAVEKSVCDFVDGLGSNLANASKKFLSEGQENMTSNTASFILREATGVSAQTAYRHLEYIRKREVTAFETVDAGLNRRYLLSPESLLICGVIVGAMQDINPNDRQGFADKLGALKQVLGDHPINKKIKLPLSDEEVRFRVESERERVRLLKETFVALPKRVNELEVQRRKNRIEKRKSAQAELLEQKRIRKELARQRKTEERKAKNEEKSQSKRREQGSELKSPPSQRDLQAQLDLEQQRKQQQDQLRLQRQQKAEEKQQKITERRIAREQIVAQREEIRLEREQARQERQRAIEVQRQEKENKQLELQRIAELRRKEHEDRTNKKAESTVLAQNVPHYVEERKGIVKKEIPWSNITSTTLNAELSLIRNGQAPTLPDELIGAVIYVDSQYRKRLPERYQRNGRNEREILVDALMTCIINIENLGAINFGRLYQAMRSIENRDIAV